MVKYIRIWTTVFVLILLLWLRSTLGFLQGRTHGTADSSRVIVMGRLKHEDTDWVISDLPEYHSSYPLEYSKLRNSWQHAIYTVDDPNPPTPFRIPKNKGRESNVYLQYIIDHYPDLPSTIVFLHSHRDGYPKAWHTEFPTHSNVDAVRNLQTAFIQRTGYANMRCNPIPGCPDEIRPFRQPREEFRTAERAIPDAWRALFNNTNVPGVIAAPCCSQFAVSREQVWKRPVGDYQWFQRWLMETDLSDDVSGRVMEYLWHVIFGKGVVQ